MSPGDRAVLTPASREWEEAAYRYSPALAVGDAVYTSGQIGMDSTGAALSDPEEQIVKAFEQIGELLGLVQLGFGDIVELSSFHADLSQMRLFTSVKNRYILGPLFPAWTAVGAALGLPGAVVEIKCTAIAAPSPRTAHVHG